MAGTIIADVIQSDQSYPSSINIASPVIISNTFSSTSGIQLSNNLTFTGTGNRITGDMSNATFANRVAFQTSTVNGQTNLHLLPNGTNTASTLTLEGDSAVTNGATFSLQNNPGGSGEVRVVSGARGTGSNLPMTFYTGGSERMRITSDGYFGFAVTSPQERLHLANRQFSSQTFRTVGAFRGALGNNPTNAIIFYANVPYIAEPGICETWLLTVTAVAQANLNQTGNRIATFLMHINRAGNNGGGGSTTTNINFTSLGTQLDTKTGSLGVSGNITMSANIPSASTGTHTCDIRVTFTNSSGASDTRCHISGFVLGSTTAQVTTITYP